MTNSPIRYRVVKCCIESNLRKKDIIHVGMIYNVNTLIFVDLFPRISKPGFSNALFAKGTISRMKEDSAVIYHECT